ncbi:MAG: acyl carrier protein [Isosphaeraceae bacterium]
MIAKDQVRAELIELLTKLAGDWDYEGEITPGTRLLRDLALESLGLVVLGTAIQDKYGRLPFTDFLAEIGQRPPAERDVTIQELVDFVCRNCSPVAAGGPS